MPKDDPISDVINKLSPYIGKITFGSFIGYCSGVAAKKVGQFVAVALGLGFIALQSAVHSGYVQVDWDKVQRDAVSRVDMDGDGEITIGDVHHYWLKLRDILRANMADAGGFSLGFLYGVSS